MPNYIITQGNPAKYIAGSTQRCIPSRCFACNSIISVPTRLYDPSGQYRGPRTILLRAQRLTSDRGVQCDLTTQPCTLPPERPLPRVTRILSALLPSCLQSGDRSDEFETFNIGHRIPCTGGKTSVVSYDGFTTQNRYSITEQTRLAAANNYHVGSTNRRITLNRLAHRKYASPLPGLMSVQQSFVSDEYHTAASSSEVTSEIGYNASLRQDHTLHCRCYANN